MNNEPNFKTREGLVKDFNNKHFSQLLKKISELQKNYSESLFLLSLLGSINYELKKYEKAINNFESIIKIDSHFSDAYYNLGIIFKNISQIDKSIDNFEKCIKINPKKFEAYNNLGNVYRDKQQIDTAFNLYIESLEINPNYLIALQNLGVCLQDYEFIKYSVVSEKHVINLLEKNKILRPVDIVNNLIKFIYLNKEYELIISNTIKLKNGVSLDKLIDEFLKIKILMQLIKITPITNLKIEKKIKDLRSKILLKINSINNLENAFKLMKLIASQCYINEYIYQIKAEEKLVLIKLEKGLKNKFEINDNNKTILKVALLASYKPLVEFDLPSEILNIPEIKDLVDQQINNPQIEVNIQKNIKSKEIKNSVSQKVKIQYEKNPYPRWEKIALKTAPEIPVKYFNSLNLNFSRELINNWDNINVLVAGCGTGQHAIATASKYKRSFITAIDLSINSLSYAKRKADELEIKNIEFVQMDILDLKRINKKFNIIESIGVLHHMDNPFEGWRILNDNLENGGMMMIGLYSNIAREHIVKIRNDIKSKSFNFDKKNIIKFREKIISSNNLDYKLIKQSPDFYSFSNLIDLLFHVQESRFTIPEINKYINNLSLKFCGFENRQLINLFSKTYRNHKDLYNLDLWNKFELDNTRIFAGMYQFWCQKI
tara:strand:- start:533 stop:2509 length:1977 start_codon:yes stop_codon:yes gene_type:complete